MWLEDQKKQEWGVQRIPMLMLLRVTPAGVEPTAKLPVKGRGEQGGGGGGGGAVIYLRSFSRLEIPAC